MSIFPSLIRSTLLQMDTLNLNADNKKVSKSSIVLSSGDDKIIMPVVPSNLPEVSLPQNNDVFSSIIADMSVIGTLGLRSLKLEGLLPLNINKYSWTYPASSNASDVINFVNKHRTEHTPFRIAITQGESCYLNMQCLINSFTYYADGVGDYHYTLDLTEYRMRDKNTGGLVS